MPVANFPAVAFQLKLGSVLGNIVFHCQLHAQAVRLLLMVGVHACCVSQWYAA